MRLQSRFLQSHSKICVFPKVIAVHEYSRNTVAATPVTTFSQSRTLCPAQLKSNHGRCGSSCSGNPTKAQVHLPMAVFAFVKYFVVNFQILVDLAKLSVPDTR